MEHTGFFSLNMLYTCLFFIMGNFIGWFASNMQFVNEFWKDKALLSVLIFGVPSMLCFWFGTRFAMQAVPSLWSVRFIGAVLSYLTFPLMTWYYMNESMFTPKTIVCFVLAMCIMLVQIFMD
jgi:uncharacterized membrane protein